MMLKVLRPIEPVEPRMETFFIVAIWEFGFWIWEFLGASCAGGRCALTFRAASAKSKFPIAKSQMFTNARVPLPAEPHSTTAPGQQRAARLCDRARLRVREAMCRSLLR